MNNYIVTMKKLGDTKKAILIAENFGKAQEKSEKIYPGFKVVSIVPLKAMQIYSDQQNKELRERLAQEDEKAIFIQRLTKEVEELKDALEARNDDFVKDFYKVQEELTRLRELLAMAKQIIVNGCVDPNPFLDSIDNALNHKP